MPYQSMRFAFLPCLLLLLTLFSPQLFAQVNYGDGPSEVTVNWTRIQSCHAFLNDGKHGAFIRFSDAPNLDGLGVYPIATGVPYTSGSTTTICIDVTFGTPRVAFKYNYATTSVPSRLNYSLVRWRELGCLSDTTYDKSCGTADDNGTTNDNSCGSAAFTEYRSVAPPCQTATFTEGLWTTSCVNRGTFHFSVFYTTPRPVVSTASSGCVGTVNLVSQVQGASAYGTCTFTWEREGSGTVGHTKDITVNQNGNYRVGYSCGTCDIRWSNWFSVNNISGAPFGAVNAKAATNVRCVDFEANWASNPCATAYLLDVSNAADFSSFVPGYNGLNVGNTTNFQVTGVRPETKYYYRVRATDGTFTSLAAGIDSATTVTSMEGLYTIGGTSPDFATLAQALTALNTKGIGGPVTFRIRPGTYSEAAYTFPAFTYKCGTAIGVTPLVIEGESTNRADVVLKSATTAARFTNGRNHLLTFRNLTIESLNATTNAALSIAAGANSTIMENVLVNGGATIATTVGMTVQNGDFEVTNILNINTGGRIITDASSFVVVSNNSTGAYGTTDALTGGMLRTNATPGWVIGNLRRYLGPQNTANQFYNFLVGSTDGFRRLLVRIPPSVTRNVTYLDCRFIPTASVNNTGCGNWPVINGLGLEGVGGNGSWSLSPNNAGSETITYDLRLYLDGMGTFVDNEFLIVSRPDGSTNRCDWVGGGDIPADDAVGRTLAGGYSLRTNLTTFSEKGIGQMGDPPLPVVLNSFTATPVTGPAVELRWSTRSEQQSAYFRIERATMPSEGFSPLLTQNAAGNSNTASQYNALDTDPILGRSYYRLVQVDLDGTEYPLDVVEVNIQPGTQAQQLNLALRPNPVERTQWLKVDYFATSETPANLRLVDLLGRSLWHQTVTSQIGWQEISIPMAEIPAGVYYLQLDLDNQQQSRKLVVVD